MAPRAAPPSSPPGPPTDHRAKRSENETMAIFLNADSKVIVQGMTGSEGMKHTQRMLKSGTTIVGGVNPRKAGTTVDFEGGVSVPVYGTVKEAIEATGANVSVIFVPAQFTKAAAVEAIDAAIPADISGTGRIGLVSKSGTLTYQMMYELRDFGFSSAVGIGGDPIIGTTHID